MSTLSTLTFVDILHIGLTLSSSSRLSDSFHFYELICLSTRTSASVSVLLGPLNRILTFELSGFTLNNLNSYVQYYVCAINVIGMEEIARVLRGKGFFFKLTNNAQ